MKKPLLPLLLCAAVTAAPPQRQKPLARLEAESLDAFEEAAAEVLATLEAGVHEI